MFHERVLVDQSFLIHTVYVFYVRRYYGSAIIVFDEYLNVSTKDSEIIRENR